MTLVFTLLTMVVLGLVSAVAIGRLGGGLDAPVSSLPSQGLPEGDVTEADIQQIRFAPALRGYRMDEVDAVVDRLTEELRRRDAELEQLRRAADPYSTPAAGTGLFTAPQHLSATQQLPAPGYPPAPGYQQASDYPESPGYAHGPAYPVVYPDDPAYPDDPRYASGQRYSGDVGYSGDIGYSDGAGYPTAPLHVEES